MMRRVGITAAAVIAIIWCGSWFFISGMHTKTAHWIKQASLDVTIAAGFAVKDVLLEGREQTDAEILLALINVQRGESIFTFNPHQAKAQIEKIGWVQSAHVERRLPDTIYIRLTERKPFALWNNNGELSLIDSRGVEITKLNLHKFQDLLMLRGTGAQDKASEIINALNAHPDLKKNTDHATLVDNRRWNIILNSGQTVKLPEKNLLSAVDHIMLRHSENNILDKKVINEIDARYSGRLIIKTKSGGVQDYKLGHVRASMTAQ